MASLPYAASAATTITNVVIGSIDSSSLYSSSSKPTLSGFVYGATTIEVLVRKHGSSKIFYKSKTITVKDMLWKLNVSKKLSDGTYDLEVRGAKKDAGVRTIATSTLTIGKAPPKAATTLVVSWIPLLAGGIAHAADAVPVAYLQITNVGKGAATLKGFYIKQNGSASTDAVSALTTLDDKATLRASTLPGAKIFTNGTALAPTDAVFAPGQMRLFTVRAVIASPAYAYFGGQLSLSVTGIESTAATASGPFPFRGVAWQIQ